MVSGFVFDWVAQQLGPELAILIAVVAFAARFYGGFSNWSIDLKITTMPISQALLSLSSALISGAQNAIQGLLNDIAEQYSAFLLTSEAEQKKLEAAQELLKQPELLSFDLLEAQQPQFTQVPNESPTAFYNRTIHTGNVGTLVLNVVPVYCDLLLKLPEVEYFTV